MLEPTKRISLSSQTTDQLRRYFASRPSGEKLLPERDLAVQLEISRPTLRAALAKLEREGLLRVLPGKGRVIAPKRKGPDRADPSHDVVLVLPVPLGEIDAGYLAWIDVLRNRLAKEQHHLDVVCQPNCYRKHPEKALAELVARRHASAWLLCLATREMQEWFDRSGLPTAVAGSTYPGVTLPAVNLDFRAAAQHAVGRFAAKGHKRVVLLTPADAAAGDLEGVEGFRRGSLANPGIEALVATHDGTVPGICRCLDRLLKGAQPPTAFLVARPYYALTAVGHLVQCGLRFPTHAALIALGYEPLFPFVVPSLAHYRITLEAQTRKLVPLVIELTHGGKPRPGEHLIIPNLVPGQTLG